MSVTDFPHAAADAAVEEECAHCGLAVPAAWRSADGGASFCCAGCRAAWHVLHDHGLAGYYALPERRALAVAPSGRSFEEFDHPAFHELYVRGERGGLESADLDLEGVHCPSCVWLVERVPRLVGGCARAELDLVRARVRVAWHPGETTLGAIARELDALGYRPHPYRGGRLDVRRRAEDRRLLADIGIAGALTISLMMVSMSLYGGWLTGIERDFERYFRWVSLALSAPAVLGPGRTFFRGAWGALRARRLHMDVPVAVALAAGFVRGTVNTVLDSGPIYFDGLVSLVALLLIGRFLQGRAQRSAADAAELMHAIAPADARVIEDGRERRLPPEALVPGMEIEVRPGETLPADGVVLAGTAGVDQALLTGESRPVTLGPGDPAFAGTTNRSGVLRVRVERCGESSRLGRMLRQVEEGAARRAPVVQLADRLSGGFIAAALGLAALTAALWWRHDPSLGIDHAIALLVVTCPCALALATPLAVTVAIGRAARHGILIKGGDALESLARPGLLVLDKTGTLTEGRARLAAWEGPEWVKPLVLAVEARAAHPVAGAFLDAWPGVAIPAAESLVYTPGGGVEGVVAGRRVRVGSPGFVAAIALGAAADAERDPAETPVWVAVDGVVVGRAGFTDAIRADARPTLERLRDRGWRTRLLSGDDAAVAAHVGRALGFAADEARGGASPESKLAAIEAASGTGTVVMVGDGVNDAAAIARATVGVGVKGGAEASLAAADVYLARPGLAPLEALIAGAERTLGVIRRAVWFSLLYNVAGVALAMAGFINPLVAAVLMPASSVTVVLIAWRGRTFEEEPR